MRQEGKQEGKIANYDFIAAEFEGMEDIMVRILKVFGAEYPTILQELEAAVANNDADATQKAAHTLKGALRGIGGDQPAHLAEKIEVEAGKGELGAAKELVEQLKVQVPQLHEELQHYLQNKAV